MSGATLRRILIVDDHPLVSQALAELIEATLGRAVCAHAGSAADALRAFRATRPDLVILDILLPDGHGLDVLSAMREIDENSRIVVFSAVHPEIHAAKARVLGAAGFVHKSSALRDLMPAIEAPLDEPAR